MNCSGKKHQQSKLFPHLEPVVQPIWKPRKFCPSEKVIEMKLRLMIILKNFNVNFSSSFASTLSDQDILNKKVII
jgi:hypothetical protein